LAGLGLRALERRRFAGERKQAGSSGYDLRTLFWECTLQCNQHCRHCGSNASAQPSEDIPAADMLLVLINLRDSLNRLGKRLPFIAVTGGEPLVRKDLPEVMRAAVGLGYSWGMTTNGLLLNETRFNALKDSKLATVSVSIDGFEQTHDILRQSPGSYETVLSNLRALLKAGFVKRIQVTTVVNPLNVDELQPLLQVLQGLEGLDSWRLATCDPIGRAAGDDSLTLSAEDTRRVLEFIVANKSAALPIIYACPSHLGPYEGRARSRAFSCFAGKQVMSVLHNGDLAACPNIPRNPATVQGNIYTCEPPFDIYPVWERGYGLHRDPDARGSSFCQGCDAWEQCRGGSLHTWDFERQQQGKCIKQLLSV
jgi:radical SAM protein with 4Fe4S-binding SPASM domain